MFHLQLWCKSHVLSHRYYIVRSNPCHHRLDKISWAIWNLWWSCIGPIDHPFAALLVLKLFSLEQLIIIDTPEKEPPLGWYHSRLHAVNFGIWGILVITIISETCCIVKATIPMQNSLNNHPFFFFSKNREFLSEVHKQFVNNYNPATQPSAAVQENLQHINSSFLFLIVDRSFKASKDFNDVGLMHWE